MSFAAVGQKMLIIDASVLYELLVEGDQAASIREKLAGVEEFAAPQLIDSEVMGILRRDTATGVLHESRSEIAMRELNDWPGDRVSLRALNERVWELRHNVRTQDAYYVALAEAFAAPLVTMDQRLARSHGPRCAFITVP